MENRIAAEKPLNDMAQYVIEICQQIRVETGTPLWAQVPGHMKEGKMQELKSGALASVYTWSVAKIT